MGCELFEVPVKTRELALAEERLAAARDDLIDAAKRVGRLQSFTEMMIPLTRTLNGEACCRLCRQTWGFHDDDDDCQIGLHIERLLGIEAHPWRE